MNRALTAASVALLLFAGLTGCGDDDEDPAVQTTPVATPAPTSDSSDADSLAGQDLECKDEIVRQMKDPKLETKDTPPECEGISTTRVVELAAIADAEVKASSAKPTP